LESCFYGAPNYGEDPASDHQERVALLVLDEPIKSLRTAGGSGTATDVSVVQLVMAPGAAEVLPAFAGRHVRVVADEWTLAETGHHHTRLVLIYTNVSTVTGGAQGQRDDGSGFRRDVLGKPCDGRVLAGEAK
jgi:hypothetical protein